MTPTTDLKNDFLNRGFSRRHFASIATIIAFGSALPFDDEPALAPQLSRIDNVPRDAVMINADENPTGRFRKR